MAYRRFSMAANSPSDERGRAYARVYSLGAGLTQWYAHRAQCACVRSDRVVALHWAHSSGLRAGFRALSHWSEQPHRLKSAQRRHRLLAQCAAEVLLLRQYYWRQALGIRYRQWAALGKLAHASRCMRLRRDERALREAVPIWAQHTHTLRAVDLSRRCASRCALVCQQRRLFAVLEALASHACMRRSSLARVRLRCRWQLALALAAWCTATSARASQWAQLSYCCVRRAVVVWASHAAEAGQLQAAALRGRVKALEERLFLWKRQVQRLRRARSGWRRLARGRAAAEAVRRRQRVQVARDRRVAASAAWSEEYEAYAVEAVGMVSRAAARSRASGSHGRAALQTPGHLAGGGASATPIAPRPVRRSTPPSPRPRPLHPTAMRRGGPSPSASRSLPGRTSQPDATGDATDSPARPAAARGSEGERTRSTPPRPDPRVAGRALRGWREEVRLALLAVELDPLGLGARERGARTHERRATRGDSCAAVPPLATRPLRV